MYILHEYDIKLENKKQLKGHPMFLQELYRKSIFFLTTRITGIVFLLFLMTGFTGDRMLEDYILFTCITWLFRKVWNFSKLFLTSVNRYFIILLSLIYSKNKSSIAESAAMNNHQLIVLHNWVDTLHRDRSGTRSNRRRDFFP
ncbi:hypothetical protein ACJX0J_016918 [Zea mays]